MDWAAIGVGVGYASVALSILVFVGGCIALFILSVHQ